MPRVWNLVGQQTTYTSYQFAEFLSHHEFWNLQKRDYETGLNHSLQDGLLGGVVTKGKMTKIHKELMKLEQINEVSEYVLGTADIEDCFYITFTRDGNEFTFEVH